MEEEISVQLLQRTQANERGGRRKKRKLNKNSFLMQTYSGRASNQKIFTNNILDAHFRKWVQTQQPSATFKPILVKY